MKIIRIGQIPKSNWECHECLIIEGELIRCNRLNVHTLHSYYDEKSKVTVNWYIDDADDQTGLIVP